jgi:thiamine-monophosphate kinase
MPFQKLSGEDRLIDWLRSQVRGGHLGDDAATLSLRESFAITVDSQIAGVHFPANLDEARFARRLLAVNLSDLAAMGAQPRFAFLALCAPEGFRQRAFFRALLKACAIHGVELAGGDLARLPLGGPLATLTLLGTRRPRTRWLKRSGAQAGHTIWLSGTVGESAVGRHLLAAGASLSGRSIRIPSRFAGSARLAKAARAAVARHLEPRPELALGEWLARRRAGGALDVSDGVARDLHRLCRESGVGAVLDADLLPSSPHYGDLCTLLKQDSLDLALSGGEDYVLLFTLPKGIRPPKQFAATCCGEVLREGSIWLRQSGRTRPLAALGWDHLADAHAAHPPTTD